MAGVDQEISETSTELSSTTSSKEASSAHRGMNDWRPFVYGGLASITAECGTFPIDTTKTRLQIQGQKIDARFTDLKYRGMSHAFFRILREEGAIALYSGIAPALLRQATYGTIKIGVYHTLKRAFVSNPKDETLAVNVLCGITAGVVSSSIANPTDVLKVRMQATGSQSKCDNMLCSFVKIYNTEGVAGLWRGVGPTAQRAAVVAGVELPAYDLCKKHILRSGLLGDTKETHFLSSFLAGLAGAIASNPIDVVKGKVRCVVTTRIHGPAKLIDVCGEVKTSVVSAVLKGHPVVVGEACFCLRNITGPHNFSLRSTALGHVQKFNKIQTRMMNQKKLKVSPVGAASSGAVQVIYASSSDCLLQTVKTEGVMALYKGFIPNWLRLGPWNIIFFMTYEQLKKTY